MARAVFAGTALAGAFNVPLRHKALLVAEAEWGWETPLLQLSAFLANGADAAPR